MGGAVWALLTRSRRNGSSTHSLSRRWTPRVQHKQVGVEHVPAVHLELDITQVGVVHHGTKILSQQLERGLGHRRNAKMLGYSSQSLFQKNKKRVTQFLSSAVLWAQPGHTTSAS